MLRQQRRQQGGQRRGTMVTRQARAASPSSSSFSLAKLRFVSPFYGSLYVDEDEDSGGASESSVEVPARFVFTRELADANIFANQSAETLEGVCEYIEFVFDAESTALPGRGKYLDYKTDASEFEGMQLSVRRSELEIMWETLETLKNVRHCP